MPSGRYWEFGTVRSVGLLYCIDVFRLLMTTVLNALNTSSRNCSWRLPPTRMLRASDRSTVLSGQPIRIVAARLQSRRCCRSGPSPPRY